MSVQGKTIAFLTSPEGIEQAELTGPWQAVRKAGGRLRLAANRSVRAPEVAASTVIGGYAGG